MSKLINALKILLQYLVPQHLLSRLVGILVNCRVTAVKNWCINRFIKRYGVDMRIAQQEDPYSYVNFNSFFTRHLKPEARPIAIGEQNLICPVDGALSAFGHINNGQIIEAKGHTFTLKELLGGDEPLAQIFQQGEFATFYLAPKDYHRIHMPITGHLQTMRYVPGRLFSVNPLTAKVVKGLFARNERVICYFQTTMGPIAIILVGAMLVASICTTWAGMVTPSQGRTIQHWDYSQENIVLKQGQELGYFQLGSTVIMLLPPQMLRWLDSMPSQQTVKMGQLLGQIMG